jgi:AmmeMemoRadiSam system protein A
MIPHPERTELLVVARRAIAASLGAAPHPRVVPTGNLARRAGAFVTLQSEGALRGCIGHVEPDRVLVDVVVSCAISAASSDPRFPPVTVQELERLVIEISVLGGLEVVQSLGEIEIGEHGLLVESGHRRGLLLPQVAPEWGWDAATFVANTCLKAGLRADAWTAPGTRLFRFEAEVFGEERDLPAT